MANIKTRRKLSDLYKTGAEARFGKGPDGKPVERLPESGEGLILDGDGQPVPLGPDEVQVWLQPPNPLHREMALRDAQASRAKSLVRAKREKDSEEQLTILAFLADMTDDQLVEYVLLQDQDERRSDAIREVLGEDEWKDITALQDALRQYDEADMTMEELLADAEYMALMEEDAKFGDQVSRRSAEIMDSQREALKLQLQSSRDYIEKKAIARRAEIVATQAFMAEYERQMLFYAVRDFDDNGTLFFESAREMAAFPDPVLSLFQTGLASFIADTAEAKNLQGVVSGSGLSELPSEPEISEASTPETQNA